MSMPQFPDTQEISREDAINQIISSIAMEELGLSHIINAEGEKLQYILGTLEGQTGSTATVEQVIEANDSVKELLEAVSYNQMFLKGKMSSALSASTMQGPTGATGATGATGIGGLNAFSGIYDNTPGSTSGLANVPLIVELPSHTTSRGVTFDTPNSITVTEAGTYYITYELLASFDVAADLSISLRSNGVNIDMTNTSISIAPIIPIYYSGTTIVDLPAGAIVDMAVVSNVDITLSIDEASIPSINIFKLD